MIFIIIGGSVIVAVIVAVVSSVTSAVAAIASRDGEE